MQVIELRNYRLREGATREFVRYFEEYFLFSQRAEGMHPLGQFEVVDEPDRFVWIDYPRLPVIQDPTLLLVLSAYRDREHCALTRRDWSTSGPGMPAALSALLGGDVATIHLRPTARSLIRYQDTGSR
jgi:hypothetical protein